MRNFVCPSCGAALKLEDDFQSEFAFCQYCGTKIMLDDLRIKHHIIDDARLYEAETERKIKLKKAELEASAYRNQQIITVVLTVIWIIITCTLLVIAIKSIQEKGFFHHLIIPNYTGLIFLFLSIFCGIGGAFLLFSVIPNIYMTKQSVENGLLQFPNDVISYSTDYSVAVETLKNIGFTNVSCINLHDIKHSILTKPGEIQSIKINGRPYTFDKKYFPKDAVIVITYHGMK